ncbi:MAG: spore germination protein GerW family protein [Armatimonadota bacterium]
MAIEKFVQTISDVQDAANVERVFGEPVELNGRSFVPVASVKAFFAGGFGRGKPDDEPDAEEGEGGGGGGGMNAEPVAVVEVSDDETIVHPIIDTNKILFGGMILGAAALCFLGLVLRPRS